MSLLDGHGADGASFHGHGPDRSDGRLLDGHGADGAHWGDRRSLNGHGTDWLLVYSDGSNWSYGKPSSDVRSSRRFL